MPLQNYQYDTIMREYNRRQARNRRIQEEHLAEAYEKIPRLREIDEEVATLSARKARALISRQEVGIEDLRNDIALLSQERTALLLSSGCSAARSSNRSVIGSPLLWNSQALKGTPPAACGHTPTVWSI